MRLNKETLEEAAENYAEHQLTGMSDKTAKFKCINDFISGAKWQAERMYSEEQLREAFIQGVLNVDCSEMYGLDYKLTEQDWFEQFKKK